jgi:hypothetical protein
MTSVFYAIGDIVKAMLPAFKALGHSANIFFSLATSVLVFYWISVLIKNPDQIRSNKVEDQPE